MDTVRILIAALLLSLKSLLMSGVVPFIALDVIGLFNGEASKQIATSAQFHYTACASGVRENAPPPTFSVSFLDDTTSYQAGDIATVMIRLLSPSLGGHGPPKLNFSLSVNGKEGNSTYISAVFPHSTKDPTFTNITFSPIKVGDFSMAVVEDFSGVTDSSLHFSVTAGPLHPPACLPSWMDGSTEFFAGTSVYLLVYPKDAFGNNVSSVDKQANDYFTLSVSHQNGSSEVNFISFSSVWTELRYFLIEFIPTMAGKLLLHVNGDNQTLTGYPLPCMVRPGFLNVSNTMIKWEYEVDSVQIFSELRVFIHQKDRFGNLVPGFYPFDAQVVQKTTGLSVPVVNLLFQEVDYGIQRLSFVVSEPGDFLLSIVNTQLNESIPNLPYRVFVGYCNGLNSFANGSGLLSSVAGKLSHFTVFLEDVYMNPSPVAEEQLYVKIYSPNLAVMVRPHIFPLRSLNGTFHGSLTGQKHVSMVASEGNNRSIQASEFTVTYIPVNAGDYEILVFCGNIPINNGSSYFMKVSSGLVDTAKSNIVNLELEDKPLGNNEVLVKLVDSYRNYVSLQEANLKMQVQGPNSSMLLERAFMGIEDGLYVGYYISRNPGTYNVCVSYLESTLYPCPIRVHVHERDYFPEAFNDTVSVWEDESVVFDVLSNDYTSDGHLSLIEFSKPVHGTLLLWGELFRYTPFKGYYGNDSFSYVVKDSNGNTARATSFIFVLCKPPQFISLPLLLNATEDVLTPQFGGFPGFEMVHSDKKENISLTISANFGTVYLAPARIDVSDPAGGMCSVKRGGKEGKELILEGTIELINSALRLIQYLSNENFYGDDTISLNAINKNGLQAFQVRISVKPINDPPKIHAPKFIIIAGNKASDAFQVFDNQRDVFKFSVTDSDIFQYAGDKSHLLFMFSVELSEGLLSVTLPVHLTRTTELKIEGSNQWQPLLTFVAIENHFTMRGRGVRFQGTIEECNNAMKRLFFLGANVDTLLTITINDLGNYGCYTDCTDVVSVPLRVDTDVILMRRRPLKSGIVALLGSAMMAMSLFLGALLLFFMCKCMTTLSRERNGTNSDQASSSGSPHGGHSLSTPLSFSRTKASFRRRSRSRSEPEGSIKFEFSEPLDDKSNPSLHNIRL